MSKDAIISTAKRQATYQAPAGHYLAQTKRILKRFAHERLWHGLRRGETPDLLATAKSILRGA